VAAHHGVRRVIVAAVVVAGFAAGYGLARSRAHDPAADVARDLDRAAGQLRSPSLHQRLSGIERLRGVAAFASAPSAGTTIATIARVIEELGAFVRNRARPAQPAATAGPPGTVERDVRAAVVALGVALANPLREYIHPRAVDLRGTDLAGADLTRLELGSVDLSGADLRATRLHGVRLRAATLDRANLRGVDLRGADLEDAKLVGTDLAGANLVGIRLRGTVISRTILDRANLDGVDFTGAHVFGVSFTGATGLGPDDALVFNALPVLGSSVPAERLAGIATLARFLAGAPTDRADLVGIADEALVSLVSKHKGPTDTPWPPPPPADVQAALTALLGHPRPTDVPLQLGEAHLQGADLRGANLRNADLHTANLTGANLRGADLSRADMWAADLTFADLTGADLTGAAIGNHTFGSAKGLTSEQVATVHFGPDARLPAGVTGPLPTPTSTR
jgi:uncharacterized protein YjbI with pentapeptide repeats